METITHDLTRHLRSFRHTLSQDKKPIGFFLSAGCPLAVDMPNKNDWPLIPAMKGLSESVKDQLSEISELTYQKYEHLLNEINLIGKDKDNLEDVLSFIRSLKDVAYGGEVRGFNDTDLNELESSICKCIVDKIKVNLPTKNTPYHKLAKWISSIERERAIEIFTTNYDLLMEQALEDLRIPYFDGFVGTRQSFFDLRALEESLIPKHWTRLWKIHGSINWFQNSKKEVFRSDCYQDKQSSYLIYPSHLKYDQSRKMPFLALSDQLGRFLKQQSSLLVMCGYSFNDEHINDTLINSLKSNPTATIIALMFGNYNTINEGNKIEQYPKGYQIAKEQHNLCLWTNDEAIIGTNIGKWKKYSDEEDFFRGFIKEENEVNIEMGDFKVFTNFLSLLIGHSEVDDKNNE